MTLRRLIMLSPALALCGCGLSMTQQPKYGPEAPAKFWSDGAAARPLPHGVVARGDLARDAAQTNPPPVDRALLERGRERYTIYCTPCHGIAGDGDGIVVQRGFPHPPSYHEKRLLAAPARHFYDVMTDGYGVMYSYATRVEPRDRWAIAAYVRALQLARHAKLAEVPEARGRLP